MPFFLLVKFSCSDLKKGISIFPLAWIWDNWFKNS
jgi:hypothetical protein